MSAVKRKGVELYDEVDAIDPDQYESYKHLKTVGKLVNDSIQKHIRRLDMCTQGPHKMIRKTFQVSVYYSYTQIKSNNAEMDMTNETQTKSIPDEGEWKIRIEGSHLDGNNPWPSSRKFSHYFRKAIIDLDETMYPNSNPIEWSSFRSSEVSDGLEITRPGKKGFQSHRIRLQLQRNHAPERFSISPDLYAAIDTYIKPNYGPDDGYTRNQVALALREYIKHNNLLDEDDSRLILNNSTLQGIFECPEMNLQSMITHLQKKLTPVPPIIMELDLQLTEQKETLLLSKCFSVEVLAEEDLITAQKKCLTQCTAEEHETSQECEKLEAKMIELIHRINGHVKKGEWMKQFAENPTEFMNKLVVSQETDERILQESKKTGETMDHDPEIYSQPWLQSTIDMILKKEQ